ncbi:DUF305 domain-containing protein [Nocardiopsis sp. NPDC058789]|uniref:DUF305 domain-containing protein n=1 Tax=Nocardiopsis TaxID=2013 RepID=UPI00366D6506
MGHVTGAASDDTDRADEESYEDGTAESDANPEDEGDTSAPSSPGRSVPLWMTVTLVALALVGGLLLGRPSYPLDTSADAGFLRDMSTHHAQAVDMALLVMDRTDDVEVHTIATDMARTQQAQIGMMQGWLSSWGLTARASEPPMTWMAAHDHGGGEGVVPETMPGWATEEEMVRLTDAEGEEAEVLFLELMIAHHLGGIDMAEAEVELGNEDLVTTFAQGMVDAQQSEVDNMERLLELRR